MLDDVQFKIEGIEALTAKIEAIDYDLKRKGGRAALRKAAAKIAEAAKERARLLDDPESPEKIYKNIGIKWNARLFKRTGDLGFFVGVLGGAKQYVNDKMNRRKGRVGQEYHHAGDKSRPGGDTWYWRLVEFGTSRTAARPFMRSALSDNTEKVAGEFVDQYGKAIDRAIKQADRKGAK